MTDSDWKFDLENTKELEQYILLIIDDSGDSPYSYVTTGFKHKEDWIVDNDIAHGTVVAYQDLPEPLSVKKVFQKAYNLS